MTPERCEACEAVLRARGVVGACDHPFPGRPLRAFWTMRGYELAGGLDPIHRVRVAIVRASTWQEAREALTSSLCRGDGRHLAGARDVGVRLVAATNEGHAAEADLVLDRGERGVGGDQRAAGLSHAGGGGQSVVEGVLADGGAQAGFDAGAGHGGDEVGDHGQGGVDGFLGLEQLAGEGFGDDTALHGGAPKVGKATAYPVLGKPSSQIHELTTPDLVAIADRTAPGVVVEVVRDSTPSVYDQFHRGYYTDARGRRRSHGYDFAAMEEAGFEVR